MVTFVFARQPSLECKSFGFLSLPAVAKPRGGLGPPNYNICPRPQSPKCLTLNSSTKFYFFEILSVFPLLIEMLVGSQVESVHTVTLNLKLNGAEWRSREPSGLLTSVSSLTQVKTNEGSASALDIECNRNAKAVAILCLLVFNTNNNSRI